ncbi:MAG: lipoate protein ligase C-terminal domain-containing protein [Acidilobus sp.]
MGVCEVKARKGLIRARATVKGGKLEDVAITGDFFLIPEDLVFELESRLRGVPAYRDAIRSVVSEVLSSARLVGSTTDDFVDAILCAIEGDQSEA